MQQRIELSNYAQEAQRSLFALERYIATCGLEVSTECTPRFDEEVPRGPGAVPGYGWIVGEAGLVVSVKSGLCEGPGYESFVATIQFWASPRPSKGATDSPDLTHPWAVRVRAGQVRSVYVSRFSDRHFQKVLPTDATLAWIAPALFEGLR